MAVITPSAAGAALTYQAASGGGDTYANAGQQRPHVRNGGGAAITVTMVRIASCSQGVVHAGAAVLAADQYVIEAGLDKILPAVDPSIYGTSVGLTYTGVTSVTVGVIA